MQKLLLLDIEEQRRRIDRIAESMALNGLRYGFVNSNANIYYLTGRVFAGQILIDSEQRTVAYFVRRPVNLTGDNVFGIRKVENISEIAFNNLGADLTAASAVGLELDALTYSAAIRMLKALGNPKPENLSSILRSARSVKTAEEVALIRESGVHHAAVYRDIPSLYEEGMTDIDLQVAIEHKSRLEGCLGQFRINGDDMELYMGNVLAGDNADTPSPYDFAMGGGGVHPSLPVGADGTILRKGMSVMVDMNGNFTGYMTDMTRCFTIGDIKDEAVRAHQLSIDICRAIERAAVPGVEAKALYNLAVEMATEAGLEHYFMGHRQQAGFIGHGVGIEVNEGPVLAPKSRDILQAGNVIALEPKFVIPGTGAVGIENTYVVRDHGLECLTNCPEELKSLI